MNKIIVSGILNKEFWIDHDNQYETIYASYIDVKRTSGVVDRLLLFIPQSVIVNHSTEFGNQVTIYGDIRTHNIKKEERSELRVGIFVSNLYESKAEQFDTNIVELQGSICKISAKRKTPYGRTICDFIIATNRLYCKSAYVPCIAWGTIADEVSSNKVGTEVVATGRMQSRTYIKNEETRIVYEVSIIEIKNT